jgi:hypothetical protein
MPALDRLAPFRGGVRLRDLRGDLRRDLEHLRLGVLDPRSLLSGYCKLVNPIKLTTTSLVPDSAEVDPRRLATDPRVFNRMRGGGANRTTGGGGPNRGRRRRAERERDGRRVNDGSDEACLRCVRIAECWSKISPRTSDSTRS